MLRLIQQQDQIGISALRHPASEGFTIERGGIRHFSCCHNDSSCLKEKAAEEE